MTLGEFLAAAASRVREAGVWDCCTFPAAWALACGHSDPMAAWRGRYSTEAEAEHLIFDAGGLVALFDQGMRDAAVPVVDGAYQPGDIGVVELVGEEAGAVFAGRRWAFVAGQRGIACVSLDDASVRAAWRPRHG